LPVNKLAVNQLLASHKEVQIQFSIKRLQHYHT